MKHSANVQRFTTLIAGVSAIALFFAVAAPHSHEHSSVSHQASTCRACRIQEGFAATPATPAVAATAPAFTTVCSLRPSDAPRVALVLRPSSPRAPPVSS